MNLANLEKRVAALEEQVAELRTAQANGRRIKDWRRTIGAFTEDAGMQQILQDAMRLREADRAKLRGRKPAKRKPRS